MTDLVDGHLELFHGTAVAGSPDVFEAREDVVPGTVAVAEWKGRQRDDASANEIRRGETIENRLHWFRLGFGVVELGWVGVVLVGLKWIGLDWIRLDWTELYGFDWIGLVVLVWFTRSSLVEFRFALILMDWFGWAEDGLVSSGRAVNSDRDQQRGGEAEARTSGQNVRVGYNDGGMRVLAQAERCHTPRVKHENYSYGQE